MALFSSCYAGLKSIPVSRFTRRAIHISKKMESGPIQNVIQEKLKTTFKPSYLDIQNESFKHNVPKGSETHFKVVVVSDSFQDKILVRRHQMIYDALAEEIKSGVHALSIVAKTPSQWQESDRKVDPSPPCLGGSKK